MTLDEENLDAIAQDVNHLLNLIKKLEERIIALEVGVRNLTTYEGFRKHDKMAGEEYWEHG